MGGQEGVMEGEWRVQSRSVVGGDLPPWPLCWVDASLLFLDLWSCGPGPCALQVHEGQGPARGVCCMTVQR